MTQNNKRYLTKFGVRIDAYNPFLVSKCGILLVLALHMGAICTLWYLPWPYYFGVLGSLLIILSAFKTLERCIFSLTNYQISFFFQDNNGWMIQEGVNTCYRVELQWAFCTKYLVILMLKEVDPYVFAKGYSRYLAKTRLILPVFFDSLPNHEFHQLRKVLILSGYA
jgi:hypothetical protein